MSGLGNVVSQNCSVLITKILHRKFSTRARHKTSITSLYWSRQDFKLRTLEVLPTDQSDFSIKWHAPTYLSIDVGHLSSEHDSLHTAADGETSEGCPAGAGKGRSFGNGPPLVQVHIHVGVWLPAETKDAHRIGVEAKDYVLDGGGWREGGT